MTKQKMTAGIMRSSKLLFAGAMALFIGAFGATAQGTLSTATDSSGPPAPPALLFSSDAPPTPAEADSGITILPAASPDSVSAVPEPSPEALLVAGGLFTLAYRRFQRSGRIALK